MFDIWQETLMIAVRRHHVGIGGIRVGRSPDVLKATLGSCVGIVFGTHQRIGLAHALLPDRPVGKRGLLNPRYVDEAIMLLLRGMRVGGDVSAIRAVLVGGGAVIPYRNGKAAYHVGARNVEIAREQLCQLGVEVVAQDVGGTLARNVIVDCASAVVTTMKIGDRRGQHVGLNVRIAPDEILVPSSAETRRLQ